MANKSIKITPAPTPTPDPEPEITEKEAILFAKKNITQGLELSLLIAREIFGADVAPSITFEVYDRLKEEIAELMSIEEDEGPEE
jgi:hypothetical protein